MRTRRPPPESAIACAPLLPSCAGPPCFFALPPPLTHTDTQALHPFHTGTQPRPLSVAPTPKKEKGKTHPSTCTSACWPGCRPPWRRWGGRRTGPSRGRRTPSSRTATGAAGRPLLSESVCGWARREGCVRKERGDGGRGRSTYGAPPPQARPACAKRPVPHPAQPVGQAMDERPGRRRWAWELAPWRRCVLKPTRAAQRRLKRTPPPSPSPRGVVAQDPPGTVKGPLVSTCASLGREKIERTFKGRS